MKRHKFILSFVTLTGFLFSSNVYAQGYLFVTGGGGGAAKAGSVDFEGGKILSSGNGRYLLGGSLSVAFNGRPGERFGEFFESDIRHEQEINGTAGIRQVRNLYLVSTAGLNDQFEKDFLVAQGRRLLIAELPREVYFSSSGQLRYVLKRFMIGGGYHSRRGIIAGLGFTF